MKVVVKKEQKAFLREIENMERVSFESLEQREDEIVERILQIARSGKPSDNVKLKALQLLWNKIRPDKKSSEPDEQVTPARILEMIRASVDREQNIDSTR